MATLETQYRNFKIDNPNSKMTFDEWQILLGESIRIGIENYEKIHGKIGQEHDKKDNREI